MARDLFADIAQTTVLTGGTGAPTAGTVENWTVASSAAFPSPSSTASPPTLFRVVDPAAPTEVMAVTDLSGSSWTVTRGYEGTTPVAHASGFTVQNVMTANWASNIPARMGWFNAKADFGARGDGLTNDTTAIQNALTAAGTTATGNNSVTVFLPPGTYMVNPLTLPHGVILQGSGKRATTLMLIASQASTGHILSNITTARMVEIRDLRINGNCANQTVAVDGIYINGGGTGTEYNDMRARVSNVHVEEVSGDCFYFTGLGVCQISDCVAWNSQGNGFNLGVDSELTNCDAGSCAKDGFYIQGNTLVSNCKSWFSGYYNGSVVSANVTAGYGNGFHFAAASDGNVCSSLYAQDNARAGFYFDSADRIAVAGWVADSNNNIASGTHHNVEFNNSYNCTVVGGHNFDRNPPNAARPVSGCYMYGGSSNCVVEYSTQGLLAKTGTGTATFQNVYRVDQAAGGSVNQTFAASFTPDNTQGSTIDIGTMTANMTIHNPVLTANTGADLVLIFTQDGTGGRTLTWSGNFKVNTTTGTNWQPTSTANARSVIMLTFNSNTGNWEMVNKLGGTNG
jgi:hypothetical protein